jgi:hypothetical protein
MEPTMPSAEKGLICGNSVCGRRLAGAVRYCPFCGSLLESLRSGGRTELSAPPIAEPPRRACLGCGFQGNPPDVAHCLQCGQPMIAVRPKGAAEAFGTRRDPLFRIDFPFGDMPIETRLRIGRDPEFSPLARQLATYETISRRHAEIELSENGLWVTDLGSTNHVYVNGEQIPARMRMPLKPGDEISFSSALRARIIGGGS